MGNQQLHKKKKASDIIIVFTFFTAICLPFFGYFFDIRFAPPPIENRMLAKFPELKIKPGPIVKFPVRFARYFNDHFGFRNTLVRWHAIAMVEWFGVSPTEKAMLGREGWLFLKNYANSYPVLGYFRGTDAFSEEQLLAWQRMLERRRDWLADRGIHYLFVVAPNKHSIYPEFIPAYCNRVNIKSRLDQLLLHMRKHSSMPILDLRPALIKAKRDKQVYWLTNTHCNDYGAYAAYRAIIEALRKRYPLMLPIPLESFNMEAVVHSGDLAAILGLKGRLHENGVHLKLQHPCSVQSDRIDWFDYDNPNPYRKGSVTVCRKPRLPSAVMFGDSFADWLKPFLSENFRRIAYVSKQDFDGRIVQIEEPDIVIQEMVERTLRPNMPHDNFDKLSKELTNGDDGL